MKTATASSKPEQFIISILKKNNLYDYFDYVGGVTFDEIRSDKTQIIENALKKLRLIQKRRRYGRRQKI